ncbi:MAG: threonylcarbamoyl-AMP synthase [Coriobacteriaceae bacterium]|nr:threonylcarbamoyl-AMP synthase [Coriobacteriaceae bacterium]
MTIDPAPRIVTVDPNVPQPALIAQAVAVLKAGKPVIFPTDTVYGVGVAVREDADSNELYLLKKRDVDKAIPWLIDSTQRLEDFADYLPDYALRLAQTFWPGPLTLVVRAAKTVPIQYRAKDGSIALRVPDSPVALALLRALGAPIATSSANPQGEAPPTQLAALDATLIAGAGLVIDGGVAFVKQPSTIVSCLADEPRLIRAGALSSEQIAAALG